MTGSATEAVGQLVDRHPFMDWLGAAVGSAGGGEETLVAVGRATDRLFRGGD